jgi:hypothetical protein
MDPINMGFVKGEGIKLEDAGSTVTQKNVKIGIDGIMPSYCTLHNQFIQRVSGNRKGLVIKGDSYVRLNVPPSGGGYNWVLRVDMSIGNVVDILDRRF